MFLSHHFGLLLLALVALVHVQGITASAKVCDPDLCVPPEHCEHPGQPGNCGIPGAICCSLLKEGHRGTVCSHHGGQCMARCPPNLTIDAAKCPADKKCCVLV